MEQNTEYVYTLKQTSQFKKDLKAVKFDEHKLDELQKERDTHLSLVTAEKFWRFGKSSLSLHPRKIFDLWIQIQ